MSEFGFTVRCSIGRCDFTWSMLLDGQIDRKEWDLACTQWCGATSTMSVGGLCASISDFQICSGAFLDAPRQLMTIVMSCQIVRDLSRMHPDRQSL